MEYTDKEKALHAKIDDILYSNNVHLYGYEFDIAKLKRFERLELIEQMIGIDGADAFECIYEPSMDIENDKVFIEHRKMLKHPSEENHLCFAETVLNQTEKNYSPRLQELFNERVENLLADIGYHAVRDKHTGEVVAYCCSNGYRSWDRC